MIKSSIKYSLLCGLFLVALFWVSVKFGSNPLLDIRHFLFDLVIYFLFIFFAQKEFKTYQNEGILHFWQGMTIAFVVYLPAAVIFTISLLLIFQMDPSIMENYREGALAFLESKKDVLLEGITQEEYAQRVNNIDFITSSDLVLSSGLKKVLAGFFITPVVSIILRKKPKQI
ncbi:MAG: DUF4199 domain-containing protein [Cyclobacteriaceae bacterium]